MELVKTKILLVGGGGREHVQAELLAKNPRVDKLYCAPGNGGIAAVAECVPIAATDVDTMVAWAKENDIDLMIVSADDPLAAGMVDAALAAGLRAFGPVKAAARIESSKIFAKNLMKKYGIPTASYETFTDLESALQYVRLNFTAEHPLVIKADGLALGKGAVLPQSVAEAEDVLREMMGGTRFGDSGRRVVIEEFMRGREVTVLAFTDGETICPMPSARDHKRAYDGDKGLNTGGMGVISPVPDYTQDIAKRCMDEIFIPTIRAMKSEGCPFAGILYFEMMLTKDGPRVIEYNSRFGDPEAQAVLPLLESDLLELFEAVIDGKLSVPRWSGKHSACVVMASGGYPEKYEKGFPIHGLDSLPSGVSVYHAGTSLDNSGEVVTNGGRVLNVCATGDTLEEALNTAYGAVNTISFEGAFWRTDIGK